MLARCVPLKGCDWTRSLPSVIGRITGDVNGSIAFCRIEDLHLLLSRLLRQAPCALARWS